MFMALPSCILRYGLHLLAELENMQAKQQWDCMLDTDGCAAFTSCARCCFNKLCEKLQEYSVHENWLHQAVIHLKSIWQYRQRSSAFATFAWLISGFTFYRDTFALIDPCRKAMLAWKVNSTTNVSVTTSSDEFPCKVSELICQPVEEHLTVRTFWGYQKPSQNRWKRCL